jgi:hypothetical protein
MSSKGNTQFMSTCGEVYMIVASSENGINTNHSL